MIVDGFDRTAKTVTFKFAVMPIVTTGEVWPDVMPAGQSVSERLDTFIAGECTWTPDEDGDYQTGCNDIWLLIEGTPTENGMKFCAFCGKPIKEEA